MTDTNGEQVQTTMKYYPFGGTRSGSVPTDKKFTGQRLDETGLYYYNARYYDATIGKFISPDTVGTDPANPQSFNRYSYCLNNPLKFTDPSGLLVDIGGIDTTDIDSWDDEDWLWAAMTLGPDIMQLLQAWILLETVAPELTSIMEIAPQVVTIRWQELDNSHPLFETPWVEGLTDDANKHGLPGDIAVMLDFSIFGGDLGYILGILAHESFHAGIGILVGADPMYWLNNYIANEAFAYSFGYTAALKAGFGKLMGEHYKKFAGFNPWYNSSYSDDNLKVARDDLGPLYANLPLWPSFGRDMFIDFAKQLWFTPYVPDKYYR